MGVAKLGTGFSGLTADVRLPARAAVLEIRSDRS
jgi:predicted NAD/FAD-binding protein